MPIIKAITRILIWSTVVFCIFVACFLYYFGDINKLKGEVERDLKNQLTCTVKLGNLDWDWDGLLLGVTTQEISLYDKENNLVLQGGPTRFVWHIKNIITGSYSHFYSIESTNLYLNAIHYSNGLWNLITIFPPGPPPKVDNVTLHNTILYLIDELNPTSKKVLYKDFNVRWEKKLFSNLRKIDLTTRVGSLTSPSFLKIKGKYTERKKFDWKKNELNLFLIARQINLANWHGYIDKFLKEPQIKRIDGEFTGVIHLKKKRGERLIKLRSKTSTKNFFVEFQNNKDISEVIEIPKIDFILKALVDQKKISIKTFKSNIDELIYTLNGDILNWSKALPEVDVTLKTNRFNFKSVKPYLPLSLLPANTRTRIEPINDEGLVELDLRLQGPLIAPKYHGTILLKDFNLTAESGFLDVIQGLEGKLVLDDEILKIDYLNIPIEGSILSLKGEVDNENAKASFNLNGKDLSIHILQDLLNQTTPGTSFLKEVSTEGKLDLNLDVISIKNISPEIKGRLNFHDVGIFIFKDEPLEVKNVIGELLLDGSKIAFNKLSGLINNEIFSIQGDLSLKEDERVNLLINAKQLKIVPYLLTFIANKTPFKPIAKTISGEAKDVDLNISGTFSKPMLNGRLSINNVSFGLPNLTDKISDLAGNLRFEGSELVIEELNGKIQNADFGIAGYIEDLFTNPKPKFRLVTGDIELSNIWSYLKEQLKTTSLSLQAKELEKLKGIAALDIFLHPDLVLGNIYFKDVEIKYKPFPFELNNLAGRVVIGEKNLSLFGLMGFINGSNNFNSDLTVFNYLYPSFNIQGQLSLGLDLPSALKVINATALNTITTDGLIPTVVNFDISLPIANISFYSTLDEMLQFELPPYIKKPVDKSYTLSGNIDFDTKDLDLYINQFNVKSDKLSLTTTGNVKNISSKNPELMLYFSTDEPNGLYMIVNLISPLMGYKIWGMIELSGSVTGTPSMYAISSNAILTDIQIPDLFGKKLNAADGTFSIYLDNEQGFANSKINNASYASLNANSISLSLNYLNPIVYLNELSLDSNPGSVFAVGSYDSKDGALSFNVNGSELDLSSLGSFIFLDPTKLSGRTNFSLMIDGAGKNKYELLSNVNGDLSFSVTDGKLGQVVLLQKGIQLANLLGQGIFGFNLKNVLSLFFRYQDGSFNTIKGDLELNKGMVKAKEFIYRAKDLFLNSFGFVDLNNSFVGLSFYGYLPEHNKTTTTQAITPGGAISIVPDAIGKKRFFIPFISSSPPRYFKFEVKGDIKKPKRITGHARHSFKWLKKRQLIKERKYVPKIES